MFIKSKTSMGTQRAFSSNSLTVCLSLTLRAVPRPDLNPEKKINMLYPTNQINMFYYGVIYIWKFVKPGHPLHGIPYIGQVYRSGKLHAVAFDERTREHELAAINLIGDKDWGLHAFIKKFGKECFKVEIVEKNTFTNDFDLKRWLNERERALIKENGGKMTCLDYMPRGGQTLNLTDGGQASSDEAIQNFIDFLHRRSETCFGNFVRNKEEWNKKNPGRAYPSIDEVITDPKTGKTYKIGQMDSAVRNNNLFNAKEDPERKAVLDEMGMVWNVRDMQYDAREEFWLNETKWFKNEYGIRNPSKISKDPRIKALGIKHDQIRHRNGFDILTDASKLKKWEEAGFIPNLAEHAMDPLFKELEKECPDLRISNPEIGNLVHAIRSKGIHVRGNREFLKKLHKKNFKMHAKDSAENSKRWGQILSGRLTCDDWEQYY